MTFSYPFVEARTAADWERWDRYGVTVTADGALVLATDPVPAFAPPATLDETLATIPIRDLALDECGDLALLSTAGEVYRYDAAGGTADRVACLRVGDGPFTDPRAVSFAADTLYVADGPAGAARLHAFSRHLLQHRWSLDEGLDDPVALLERDGLLAVLDRGLPGGSGDDSKATPGFVATVDENATLDVVHWGLGDVVDVATDDRGWLYVLVHTGDGEAGPEYAVRVFDADDDAVDDGWAAVGPSAFPRDRGTSLALSCLAVSLDRSLYVGVAAPPDDGGGVYRLALSDATDAGDTDATGAEDDREPNDDEATPGVETTRLSTVTTGCAGLLLAERRAADTAAESHVEGTMYLLGSPATAGDAPDRRVLAFERTRRNRPSRGGPGRFAGRAVARFEADALETVWHRVQAAVEPGGPGTRVRLRYVAFDDPAPGERATSGDDTTAGADSVAGRMDAVTTPGPPEGFERLPGLSPAVAARLREANVLGVAGLAELGVDEVLAIVKSVPEPVSSTDVRRWLHAADRLASQWVPLDVSPPTDALLDETAATGRSLWVELELLGDEYASPTVESLRAYFPRASYLQYLPAVYREDPTSAEFLLRFLSLFESTYVGLEAAFAGFSRYLDATGVPEEHLGWLAEWVGVSLDETWSEETRRELLRRAPQLSAARGTRAGLTALLELLLEDVEERSLASAWAVARERERETLDALDAAGLVDDVDDALSAHEALEAEYASFLEERVSLWEFDDFDCVDTAGVRATVRELLRCPQCFVVLVRAAATDEQWRALRRAVASETPAHAVGDVVALQSRIEVGTHTYLGVNSVVSDGQFLVESASLGRDSTVTAREPRGQLDVGARLGTDSRLS